MQSFISRFRNRAVSGSTTVSAISEDGPLPITPDTPTFRAQMADMNADDLESTPRQPHLERKILPHVHELMERYEWEEDLGMGLKPPPPSRRTTLRSKQSHDDPGISVSRVDSNLLAIQEQGPSRQVMEEGNRDRSSPSPSNSSSSGKYKRSFSRISQKLSTSGVWSTFGKSKDHISPRLSAFGVPSPAGQMRVGNSYNSTRSMSQDTVTGSSPAIRSLQSEISVDQYVDRSRPASNVFSFQSAPSSLQVPQDDTIKRGLSRRSTNSSRQKSSTKHSSMLSSLSASPSQVLFVHTPVLQALDINASSPRTFGHPASLSKSSDIHTVSNSSPSIIPAYPPFPFQTPGLDVQALATRSQPILQDIPNENFPPIESHFQWKTFPQRRRRSKTESCIPNENSVPFPASSPASQNRTRVRRLFPSEQRSPRHRTSTLSDRRISAEWNSRQASRGILTSNEWQARVSREMLRLSFGEDILGEIDAERPGNMAPGNAEIRRPHVQNVPARPSEAGQVLPCFEPFDSHLTPTHNEGNQSGDKQAPHDQTRINAGRRREGDSSSRRMSVQNGGSVKTTSSTGSVRWNSVAGDDARYAARQTATLPRSTGSRKSILLPPSASITSAQASEAGSSSLLRPPSSTTAPKRSSLRHPARSSSEPTLTKVLETPPRSTKGKRKAEDDEGSPPRRATFALPAQGTPRHRTHLQSEPSPPRAPSAFPTHQRKRARLSSISPSPTPAHSRPSSSQYASGPLSTPTRTPAAPPSLLVSAVSRAASIRSSQQYLQPPTPTDRSINTSTDASHTRRLDRGERGRTISEVSIPISALIAPHPPSMERSSIYHMRDPRRPTIQSTSWGLHLGTQNEEGSPIHAWLFFIGFLLFPLWWAASFAPLPHTRKLGGTDVEKALVVDDPQVEHDARSWRFRCRVMSGVAFLTYVPFIILIAIFAPR